MAAKDDYLLEQLVDLGFVTNPQVESLRVEADAAGVGVVDLLRMRSLVWTDGAWISRPNAVPMTDM